MVLFVKSSILFMLARFFAPFKKWVIFTYAFIGFLVAFTITMIIVKINICSPISTFWLGINVTHGKCLKQLEMFLVDTSVSMISDLVLLILPMFLIGMLRMPFTRKVRVMCILAAGGLACVSTIVRFAWLVVYHNSQDQTYVLAQLNLLA
jgi:hypothetical protein